MDINKFTIKSQEALQSAQDLAIELNNQEVDGEHLLLTLVEQEQGLAPKMLTKLDVNLEAFKVMS